MFLMYLLFQSFYSNIALSCPGADKLCVSPVTVLALNESGSNTSHAQPINHWQALPTNHLLIERSSHEFLIAFVLFNSPDQTEKIQTRLEGGRNPGNIFLFGSQQAVIDGNAYNMRVVMKKERKKEREKERKREKRGE